MAQNFCLLPQKANEFKKDLETGKLKMADLLSPEMTSERRTEIFRKYAGDAAPQVNLAFEEKRVLKNTTQGMRNFLNKAAQMGRWSPEKIAELEQARADFRAKQQERILNPQEGQAFYNDLADKLVDGHVTEAEVKEIVKLKKQSSDLFEKYNSEARSWNSVNDRLTYGASKVLETKYISELKGENTPWNEILSDKFQEYKSEPYKPKAITKAGADALKTITDNSIALVASVDNSFIGRQGINVLMTHPSIWWDGTAISFENIAKEIGATDAMEALMADIYSRPNYIEGDYDTAGILAKSEEQFPTSLPEQIPYAGRVFKASESAFKGSALVMRTGLYDLYSDLARNGKVNMDKVQIQDIGKVVNSLTARGQWGKYGESPIVKLLLWAPRMIKANLDVLTAHGLGTGLKTPFARKIAAKNWLKIVSTLVISLATINAILRKAKVGNVEWNPLSTDFAKVIINSDGKLIKGLGSLADFVGISSQTKGGKTTFDISGGKASYITLAARFILNKTKSASTGITTEGGSGFGLKSRFDYLLDFLTGKTTPAVGTAISYAKGTDYSGNKPTILGTLYKLHVPISIQNGLKVFGIGENDKQTNWGDSESEEFNQFKEIVGEEKFKEANKKYNDTVNTNLDQLVMTEDYKKLSDEDKQKAIDKLKSDIKKQIFSENGYEPFENGDKDWNKSPSKELKDLKEKIGEDKFKEANEKYNLEANEKIAKKMLTESYKKMSEDSKKKEIAKIKETAKLKIFSQYHFTSKNKKSSNDPLGAN